MEIEIPPIPAGVLTLLALFAPYAIAALNGALEWVKEAWQKKLVTVVVAVVLAAVVTVLYYATTGDLLPSWPVFILLSISITAASYGLLVNKSAKKVEAKVSGNPADGL